MAQAGVCFCFLFKKNPRSCGTSKNVCRIAETRRHFWWPFKIQSSKGLECQWKKRVSEKTSVSTLRSRGIKVALFFFFFFSPTYWEHKHVRTRTSTFCELVTRKLTDRDECKSHDNPRRCRVTSTIKTSAIRALHSSRGAYTWMRLINTIQK